jgi:hypothetical protein
MYHRALICAHSDAGYHQRHRMVSMGRTASVGFVMRHLPRRHSIATTHDNMRDMGSLSGCAYVRMVQTNPCSFHGQGGVRQRAAHGTGRLASI